MFKLLILILIAGYFVYSRYRVRMIKLHGYYDFQSAQFYLIAIRSAPLVLRVAPVATGNMSSHYVIDRMDPVESVITPLTLKDSHFAYRIYTKHRTLEFNFKAPDKKDPERINLTLIVRTKGDFPLSLRRYKPKYSSAIRLFQNLDHYLTGSRLA